MRSIERLSSEQAAVAEREYVEHRRAVCALVQREFPDLRDEVEELYQQAWVEFLELRASGVAIENARALLQKIAWRAARGRVRKHKAELHSPDSRVFEAGSERAPTAGEYAEAHVDWEALRVVVESLEPRQATVLKLRFDYGLTGPEVQSALGISRKSLKKIVTAAYATLARELEPGPDGDSPWLRRQRSLLLTCEVGIASPQQLARARRVVEAHPGCRAMLAHMRATLHDAALLLPAPVVLEEPQRLSRMQLTLDRLSDLWLGAKQLGYQLMDRLPGSGALEQAGVGGAAISAGATAKVIALCLAAGGTAAFCAREADLFEHTRPGKVAAPEHHESAPVRREPRPVRTSIVASAPAPAPTPPKRRTPTKRTTSATAQTASVSSSSYQTPASPAPAGGEEFGPGAIGSTNRPAQPAPAPSDGGGEFTP